MKNVNISMGNGMSVALNVAEKENTVMNKTEFANKIAAQVLNGEVKTVEKANGTRKIGICMGEGDVRPNIYIDDMFEQGYSVEQAVEKVKAIYEENKARQPQINIDEITDYESAKGKLRLRLYNKETKAEVFTSAKKYGFDDLILVPYVELGKQDDNLMSIKVTKQLLTSWGVTKTTIINQAMRNSKELGGFKVKSMRDTLIELMGEGAEAMLPPDEVGMTTITNADKHFGALGAIVCAKELERRFPNGYFIIPSSIHECIAIPRVGADAESLAQMINEVNTTQVAPEEVLGWKAYEFEGVA